MDYTMEPFEETTKNEPMEIINRRMVESKFENCDLTASHFYRVHFKESIFSGANMSKCKFYDVTLGDSKISHTCFTKLEIDGNLTDMVINNVPLKDLITAWEKESGKKFP